MRVLHCCLANFYIDNYSYQENILPKMHKLQGHEVAIIASTETYLNNREIGYVKSSSYFTEDGIPITRLSYVKSIPQSIARKLRIYKGIINSIEEFKPDIIFLHGCQFLSIREIKRYAKKNPELTIYIDNHADLINSAKNWISKNILHRIIYKYCAQIIEPFTKKFYGVLPARVDFLEKLYNLPSNKIDLLLMGFDDVKVNFENQSAVRLSIRNSLDIQTDDFVILTGGKLDKRKNIHILMQAVKEINDKNIKLIVFGTPNEEMKNTIEKLSTDRNIINVGWVPPDKVYDYFFAADLAFFPGTHSVLWEQAVGVGLPCVFKKWNGMQHVDVGGNCLFIESDSVEEIKSTILNIFKNEDLYLDMKQVAIEKGATEFSYYNIAKKAIEQ